MRLATWNVNSLPARLERLEPWLGRALPDVVLLQETKLADASAPHAVFRAHGYELAHHGEGRWNGVAIASRVGLADVVTNFGEPLRTGAGEAHPLAEARMIAATCGPLRVVSVYAPNGRSLGSPFYLAKLAWLDRLLAWVRERHDPGDALVIGGDFNVAPGDLDVWDPSACHGGTHVSPPERARIAALEAWGLVDLWRSRHPEGDRYSWWDYRAGMFHKNFGMRIDLLLASRPVTERIVWTDIDRAARKGKPTPSDHAPVLADLDEPGAPLDTGWEGVDARVAARRRAKK